MGINYAQMNKITESIKSFKKAIILDPKNLNARTYLAKAFAQKGNFDEAIKHLEIALKQNPNLNSIRIQLSLMYWKNQNQPLEAKKLLQWRYNLAVILKKDLKFRIGSKNFLNNELPAPIY